jgi:DNA adenine methylase
MRQESVPSSGLKSAIKWVGGKKRIARQIVNLFPREYNAYFEPFLGGGSVFLEASPKRAFLSDLNPSLINFYVSLRDEPESLVLLAEEYEVEFNGLISQEAKKAFYYEVRQEFNDLREHIGSQNAARFLFLNKTAFNGLYRESSKGEFNVPFNNKVTLKLFERENIFANSLALKGVSLESSSFLEVVSRVNEGDLVYFDPPYIPLSATSAFTDYTKSAFGPEAQLQLLDL